VVDESLVPKEVNAVEGLDFKISIPYTGGPVNTANFSLVKRNTDFPVKQHTV